jgi:hypothetical protein
MVTSMWNRFCEWRRGRTQKQADEIGSLSAADREKANDLVKERDQKGPYF